MRSAGTSLIRAVASSSLPFPVPGFCGLLSGGGMRRSGIFISSLLRRRGHVGPWRIDVVPDPAGELAGIPGLDRLELGRDAVARAELHLALLDPGLEAIQRAHGRPADDLSLEVVDAAVAGTDEALRRGHVVHRAAEVSAAARDRDVRVRILVLLRRALAHERGRLPRLADPLDDREDHRLVGLGCEAAGRADALPELVRLLEDRRDREAPRRQHDDRPRNAADRLPGHGQSPSPAHRLALEVARGVRLRWGTVAS